MAVRSAVSGLAGSSWLFKRLQRSKLVVEVVKARTRKTKKKGSGLLKVVLKVVLTLCLTLVAATMLVCCVVVFLKVSMAAMVVVKGSWVNLSM